MNPLPVHSPWIRISNKNDQAILERVLRVLRRPRSLSLLIDFWLGRSKIEGLTCCELGTMNILPPCPPEDGLWEEESPEE